MKPIIVPKYLLGRERNGVLGGATLKPVIDDAMLARAERAYMAKTTRGKRTRDMLRIVIAAALGGAK